MTIFIPLWAAVPLLTTLCVIVAALKNHEDFSDLLPIWASVWVLSTVPAVIVGVIK